MIHPRSHLANRFSDAHSNERRHYKASPTFSVSPGNAAVLSGKSNTIDWNRKTREQQLSQSGKRMYVEGKNMETSRDRAIATVNPEQNKNRINS